MPPSPQFAEVWPRWSDMDSYRHVNHAQTVTLLEEARHVVEQAKEAGPAAALEAERGTEEGT